MIFWRNEATGDRRGLAYLRSDAFERHLERTLSTLSGGTIEFGNGTSLQRVLPTLRLTVPSAGLRSNEDGSTVERVRVEGLELEASLHALISTGRSGDASIAIATATAIVSSAADDAGRTEPAQLESFASVASVVADRLGGLRATLPIEELDLIVRDARSRSLRWRAAGLRMETGAGGLEMTADVAHQGGVSRPLIVHVTTLEQTANDISGNVRIEIQDASDADSPVNVWSSDVAISGDRIALSALEYRDGTGWLRGELQLERTNRALSLTGDVEVRRLELAALARRLQQSTGSDEVDATRLFEYRPFDWRLPGTLVADVGLRFGAIRLGDLPVVNGDARLKASRGRATVNGESLSLLGGRADLDFTIDTRTAHQTAITGQSSSFRTTPSTARASSTFAARRSASRSVPVARACLTGAPSRSHVSWRSAVRCANRRSG